MRTFALYINIKYHYEKKIKKKKKEAKIPNKIVFMKAIKNSLKEFFDNNFQKHCKKKSHNGYKSPNTINLHN